jgi:prepilin-type N-terminal cleavage/methylation domain-containing protein
MLRKNSKQGFSLVEIMTAIGIMGLVIVTICGVFVYGLNAIKKGKYRACAIHIANQKFTELEEADTGNNSGIPTDKLSVPPDSGGLIEGFSSCNPNNIPYIDWINGPTYEIFGKEYMENIPYNFSIKIENYTDNLKKITVNVQWKEIEGVRHIELCKLLSRTM